VVLVLLWRVCSLLTDALVFAIGLGLRPASADRVPH
jgi:hypothetical protein